MEQAKYSVGDLAIHTGVEPGLGCVSNNIMEDPLQIALKGTTSRIISATANSSQCAPLSMNISDEGQKKSNVEQPDQDHEIASTIPSMVEVDIFSWTDIASEQWIT